LLRCLVAFRWGFEDFIDGELISAAVALLGCAAGLRCWVAVAVAAGWGPEVAPAASS
jgi:hypothetical protein